MIGYFNKAILYGAVLLAIGGCETSRVIDGELRDLSIRYSRPTITPETGSLFQVGTNYSSAFAATLRRLRQAGFEITASSPQSGEIEAQTNNSAMLDCGRITVGALQDGVEFPANAAVALLEVPAGTEGATFLKRQFSSHTRIVVRVGVSAAQNGAIVASVSESHTATLNLKQAGNDTVVFDQTVSFSGAETSRFRRGVECGSSGGVRAAILGN